jgi:hypothetical protein
MAKKVIGRTGNLAGKGSWVDDPDDENRSGIIIRFANDNEFWVDWDEDPVKWVRDNQTNEFNGIEVELCCFI